MPRKIDFSAKVPWSVSALAIVLVIFLALFLYSSPPHRDHAASGTKATLRGIVQGHVHFASEHGATETDALWPKLVEHEYLPADMGPGCLDAWDNAIQVSIRDNLVEARSDGPDGVPSDDDLVYSLPMDPTTLED